MKNTIISEKEEMKVLEILVHVEELSQIHENNVPKLEDVDVSDVEKIHSLIYVYALGEFYKSASLLRYLVNVYEEEFVKDITDDGKRTIEEVLHITMMNAVADMLSGH